MLYCLVFIEFVVVGLFFGLVILFVGIVLNVLGLFWFLINLRLICGNNV